MYIFSSMYISVILGRKKLHTSVAFISEELKSVRCFACILVWSFYLCRNICFSIISHYACNLYLEKCCRCVALVSIPYVSEPQNFSSGTCYTTDQRFQKLVDVIVLWMKSPSIAYTVGGRQEECHTSECTVLSFVSILIPVTKCFGNEIYSFDNFAPMKICLSTTRKIKMTNTCIMTHCVIQSHMEFMIVSTVLKMLLLK